MNKISQQSYTNIKWYYNIPIVLVFVLLIMLGVRSKITDDNRYGWGTFSKQANYVILYSYTTKDGIKHNYIPGDELKGEANLIRRIGSTRYSIGLIEHAASNYLKYLFDNKNPENNIKSINAEIYYVVNKHYMKKFSKEDATLIELYYP